MIFSYRTGIKDKYNNIHFPLTAPGYVKELAGIDIYDSESLYKPVMITSMKEDMIPKDGHATVWRDLVRLPSGGTVSLSPPGR
ncbi:type 1 glutamine amidotransferase family protein [Neobacillus ginsengisoli]|uniref:Uncharacterized protein n=1 Tax=Neobacillus ginsengisoli TaxID=904295 RepID=A0ABT9Y145_9BACI|nr:hypothetical protein [Neobacillus ginsengisoli]MDQ0201546.1 hypothetical protein [Neobacillus ginsengisoli]